MSKQKKPIYDFDFEIKDHAIVTVSGHSIAEAKKELDIVLLHPEKAKLLSLSI